MFLTIKKVCGLVLALWVFGVLLVGCNYSVPEREQATFTSIVHQFWPNAVVTPNQNTYSAIVYNDNKSYFFEYEIKNRMSRRGDYEDFVLIRTNYLITTPILEDKTHEKY